MAESVPSIVRTSAGPSPWPCSQMQAMAYGTIPVVAPVGGLVDTVVYGDLHPSAGTRVVAATLEESGTVDALHRGLRAWLHARAPQGDPPTA